MHCINNNVFELQQPSFQSQPSSKAQARLYIFPLPPTTCTDALRGCFLPPPLLPLRLLPFCFFPPPCCDWDDLRFCWADVFLALFPTSVGRSLQAGRQLCMSTRGMVSKPEQIVADHIGLRQAT